MTSGRTAWDLHWRTNFPDTLVSKQPLHWCQIGPGVCTSFQGCSWRWTCHSNTSWFQVGIVQLWHYWPRLLAAEVNKKKAKQCLPSLVMTFPYIVYDPRANVKGVYFFILASRLDESTLKCKRHEPKKQCKKRSITKFESSCRFALFRGFGQKFPLAQQQEGSIRPPLLFWGNRPLLFGCGTRPCCPRGSTPIEINEELWTVSPSTRKVKIISGKLIEAKENCYKKLSNSKFLFIYLGSYLIGWPAIHFLLPIWFEQNRH